MATDVAFAVEVATIRETVAHTYILWMCVAVLVLSVVVNSGGLAYFLRREMYGPNGKDFRLWLSSNATPTALIVFLSATNLGVLRILSSRVLNLGAFSAPLTKQGEVLAGSIGLLSNLTEDLPQLIVSVIAVWLCELRASLCGGCCASDEGGIVCKYRRAHWRCAAAATAPHPITPPSPHLTHLLPQLPYSQLQALYVSTSEGATFITVISLTVTVFAFLSAVVSRLFKLVVIGDGKGVRSFVRVDCDGGV